ncbi:MAG TPA: LuxR C-terminal-related transcriptional regulator [Planosporangium sp.]|nr:LuxR C-terminal-related transcriptional regulator [Planosporangium sp.]
MLGREAILHELRIQVKDPLTRILTLTGPSGMGKSRLAVALFEEVVTDFVEGGCYLDAVANTPENLLKSLAAATGAPEGPASSVFERLVEHLSNRHFFIVIDSAEQLLEIVSSTVVTLAAACPDVTVLVVSIEKLGVYGEHVIRLGPLEIPAPSLTDLSALGRVPSAKLFVHRARAVRSGFHLTRENQQAVAELCRRLDGLPLAIELAAALLQLTGPQDLLARLDGHPDLLRGTQANTLSRHTCLEASFEKGWRRLTTDEQELLCRLAVFAGEFSHADMSAIAELPNRPTPHLLASLVDKSFLLATERPAGDISFRILRITRDYLLARAGDTTETRQRHADYFLALAESARPELRGSRQAWWLGRLHQYQDDLDAAVDFLVERGDGASAGRLVDALVPYWLAVGLPGVALRRLQQAQAIHGLPGVLRARLTAALGSCATVLGDLDLAEQYLSAADRYAVNGDEADRAMCRHFMAQLAHRRGDAQAAEELLIEVAERYGRLGDRMAQACAVGDLAGVYQDEQLHEPARRLAEEAMAVLLKGGDSRRAAHLRFVLAGALYGLGDAAEAEDRCREALVLVRGVGDRAGAATGLITQAWMFANRHGRITEAWRRVARLSGAADAMLADMSATPPRHLAAVLAETVEEARARLGDDAFELGWAQGRALGMEAAVDEALAPLNASRSLDEAATGTMLTLREQEVAELVAAGLTNRAIARRLGIAEWTVVNHMRKVMRKLRCSSRVQVARWVTRQQQTREQLSG